MIKEKIEAFAKEKWLENNLATGTHAENSINWHYFLKGVEVTISAYKYQERDMFAAHAEGRIATWETYSDGVVEFKKWLKDYEIFAETHPSIPPKQQ